MTTLHRIAACCVAALSAAGCATQSTAFRAGDTATVEGRIVRIDTAPWAYDGNATVTVATGSSGEVVIALPARWNLCKAPSPDLERLHAGDRVRATGEAADERTLVVCASASHGLARID